MRSIVDFGACRRAALAFVLALAGCGGGTDGDAPTQVPPEPNAVAVSVLAGETGATASDLRVYGTQGIFRIGQRAPDGRFLVKLEQLSGPYAVTMRFYDDTTGALGYLGTLASQPGAVNLTPLTTFAAAQLFGRDPTALFGSLGGTGDAALAAVTPAALADAQVRVKAYLMRRHGYTVPAAVGDFFAAPFRAQAGDPMFDAITALNTLLADRGTNVFQVAAQIGDEARLCNAERVVVTASDGPRDFCPAGKSTLADEADATVTRYEFSDSEGSRLSVRGRGGAVLSASLQAAGNGSPWACAGSACTGLTLGTAAGDGTRPVVFATVRLRSANGSLTLDGRLVANAPGAFFPPLACDNRYYVAHADNRVDAACAAPDNSIGAGFGDAYQLGTNRRRYLFRSDGSVEPPAPDLEIVADPDGLVSVLVQDIDPATSRPRTLWTCRGAGCRGVTLGPVRDDADTFPPYVLRHRLVTLDDTVLAALNPDGTVSSAGSVTVRARLDSFEIVFPPEQQPASLPCASADQRLAIRLSDEARVYEECLPASIPDGTPADQFLRTRLDDAGDPVFFIGSNVSAFGGFYASGGVTIETAGGSVARITYLPITGGTYRCEGAACGGITITAPDAAGARRIAFDGALLQEVTTGGLLGDRNARVEGAFDAPPPP